MDSRRSGCRGRAALVPSCLFVWALSSGPGWAGQPACDTGREAKVIAARAAAQRQGTWESVPAVGMRVTPVRDRRAPPDGEGGPRGGCPPEVVAHTDANFEGGSYIIQAGFAETEIAAASYSVPAGDFPLKITLTEMIFAQNHWNETVTEWSLLIWEGDPETGTLTDVFSSDDVILPHLRLPLEGSQGANLAVAIDPGDPEQIILYDDGTHTFSVGYRIDQHNYQVGSGCNPGDIPSQDNAFPTTDVSGLEAPSGNWLWGINCGPFGCPPYGGWTTFGGLSLPCRPSGDWVLRVTYEPLECQPASGACCRVEGTCDENVPADQCAGPGEVFHEETSCLDAVCEGACCFDGGCIPAEASACADDYQGIWLGPGTECTPAICDGACCLPSTGFCQEMSEGECDVIPDTEFLGPGSECSGPNSDECPTSACCMPDGSCIEEIEPLCVSLGGEYLDGQTCATAECPQPVGACCYPGGNCLEQEETVCLSFGGQWQGPGTQCPEGCEPVGACCFQGGGCLELGESECVSFGGTWAGDGTVCPDDCEVCDGEPNGDMNGDLLINGHDIASFVDALLGAPTPEQICAGDFDGSGDLGAGDIPDLVNALLTPP